ncbi:MAG: YbhB/YbcL family Raf kinase inhibitor-like protein [Acidimicrobiia bacterium]|nr:YbhB/YbcL family Raf kinase inhibitor-like protein [Acidimicrobiia bacterium]
MTGSPRGRGLLVVGVVLAALVLGGCGGDGKTLREPPPGATAPLRSTTTTAQGGSVTVAPDRLALTSPAFAPGGSLPARFTCDGEGVAPPLSIGGAGTDVVELAIVARSQDEELTTHWVVAGLEPGTTALPQGALPSTAVVGANADGGAGWLPPCPPAGESQTVQFDLYALREPSGVTAGMPPSEAVSALLAAPSGRAALTARVER